MIFFILSVLHFWYSSERNRLLFSHLDAWCDSHILLIFEFVVQLQFLNIRDLTILWSSTCYWHETRPHKQHVINTLSVFKRQKAKTHSSDLTFSLHSKYPRQKARRSWIFSVLLSTKWLVHCVLCPWFTKAFLFSEKFWNRTSLSLLALHFIYSCRSLILTGNSLRHLQFFKSLRSLRRQLESSLLTCGF